MMQPTVIVIGTFDTKYKDFLYLYHELLKHGVRPLLIDTSLPTPTNKKTKAKQIDLRPYDGINAEKFYSLGGENFSELRKLAEENRELAFKKTCECAKKVVLNLFNENRAQGIIGAGGSNNSLIVASATSVLPWGFPKVILSTESERVSSYPENRGIDAVQSIADISGARNFIIDRMLINAAASIAGMAWVQPALNFHSLTRKPNRPLIAFTMFGVTTDCVQAAQELLEKEDFQCITFHAVAPGRRCMESMINEGLIDGVCDITTVNISNIVGKGVHAVDNCLEAAVNKGIPQVISVGALDMINFYESLPAEYLNENRTIRKHNSSVTLVRTTKTECEEIGKLMAKKLNNAELPPNGKPIITLLFPTEGISEYDKKEEKNTDTNTPPSFYDPEAREALFYSLKKHIDPQKVHLLAVPCHINDPTFAVKIAKEMKELMQPVIKANKRFSHERKSPSPPPPNYSAGELGDTALSDAPHSTLFSPVATGRRSPDSPDLVKRTCSSPSQLQSYKLVSPFASN